jgi:hypothetical protein
MSDGMEEFLVEEIINSQRRGRGWQFLVRWAGCGAEEDWWLSVSALQECKALDKWYASGGDSLEGSERDE